MDDSGFWPTLDRLIAESEIIIDRRSGSRHPRYPDFIYPFDYGYLKGTASPDGNEIDICRGSLDASVCDAVICTVDLLKRDSEIKLLLGCTEDEKRVMYDFFNESEYMKGLMFRRG